MEIFCATILNQLKHLLNQIDDTNYVYKSKMLDNHSIGQHVRHILELYICLMNGYFNGEVCYDKRERNPLLENDRKYALHIIDKIKNNLCKYDMHQSLKLVGNLSENLSEEDQNTFIISSNFQRELLYCMEHAIHHMALIKIALVEQRLHQLVPENFGVHPATIRYLKQCAQ